MLDDFYCDYLLQQVLLCEYASSIKYVCMWLLIDIWMFSGDA